MEKLKQLQKELQEFSNLRDWDKFHTPKNLAAALSVESAELLEIFQWLSDEEAINAATDKDLKSRSEEEIADVFIYLLRLADKMGIDIFEAAFQKLKKSAEKYPIELSKGNALKYNQRKS